MSGPTTPATDGPPGLDRLWEAYGRGSAMLFGSAPGACIDLRHGGSLTLSGEPFLEMNWGVVGEATAADEGPAHLLQRFVGVIRSKGVDAYLMAPSSVAAGLTPVAARLGLATSDGSPLMLRRRTPDRVFVIQQETVTVERVRDEWALEDVAGVLEAAFEAPAGVVERAFPPQVLDTPGLEVFVLRLDGEAASAVMTTRVGDLLGLWAMGTTPALRRRRLGRHLLEAVIDVHGDRPDPPAWFFLTASPAGKPLYETLGFVVVDTPTVVDVPARPATPA